MEWKSKDSKAFWKLLDRLDQKKGLDNLKENITPKSWNNHFKKVFMNEKTKEELPKNTKEKGPLDFQISIDELKEAKYILRFGKSPGYDRISNEMLHCLTDLEPELIRKLFNAIINKPNIISNWCTSMISPIHKKGSKTDPDNYRGISLISCFAKYFLVILNKRLLKYVIDNKILSKSQLGYLPGNRTADALLILHNMVDLYCHKQKKRIFGCFVDFSKAFDSIPRHTLFQKLLDYQITGNFYECLVNLYTNNTACVKMGTHITEFFNINQGVKQGCILSPLLFNIFMSDLPSQLEQEQCKPIYLTNNSKCGCLIWADDLLILSESEEGLQNMLNSLNTFALNNGLKANLDKTKVMIFNKNGRLIHKKFTLGRVEIQVTREYKYLGFKLTPSGEINSGLHDLKDRALRAYMKMKKKLGLTFRKHLLITLKLFDTLIKPILLYASDFWGILKLPKNNPLETLYISFCKQLLGVQKQTTNIGVLLELGVVPLHLYAKKNAIKNWNRIAKLKGANELTLLSFEKSLTEELSWPMQIKSNLTEIGMLENFITHNYDTNFHKKFFQRLHDIFNQDSFSAMNKPESKLRIYKTLKNKAGFENYLSKITSPLFDCQITNLI